MDFIVRSGKNSVMDQMWLLLNLLLQGNSQCKGISLKVGKPFKNHWKLTLDFLSEGKQSKRYAKNPIILSGSLPNKMRSVQGTWEWNSFKTTFSWTMGNSDSYTGNHITKKHCQRRNGPMALSTLTHSTILIQSRSFDKI